MPDPDRARLPRPALSARPLAELAVATGLSLAFPASGYSDPAVPVGGLTLDSRKVCPGDLYAALPGAHAHGSEFAREAAARGAVAILTDLAGADRAAASGLPVLVTADPRASLGSVASELYGHPSDRLLTIGVTGTNGKTTAAYMIEAGLRGGGFVTGLLGTVQTVVAGDAVPSERTTPEAPEVHALLALMVERGCSAVAMEVSSHALALGRVDGVSFDVALFTNLSQDHLDFHSDLEDYYRAKASLFIPERTRSAVVNVDDAYGRRLQGELAIPVTTFSTSGGSGGDDVAADWVAENVVLRRDGSTFEVVGPDNVRANARVRLPGLFNVSNGLGAIVSIVVAGVPLPTAAEAVASLAGVPGRMERVDAGQDYLALVDYAHTPDAVRTLLSTVREVTRGRVILVLGCGGDRDRGKRPMMGAAAVTGSDLAVFTNDNPRSEDPQVILAAMLGGARAADRSGAQRIVVEPDRAAAIAYAVSAARAEDTLVVAGKGHESGQEIAGEVRPFDDRAVLRAAIERMAVAS